MTLRPLVLALPLALALAVPGPAGQAGDLLFDADALAPLATGTVLEYSHARDGTAGEALSPLADGRVEIVLAEAEDSPDRSARVTLTEGERARQLTPFPGRGANPVLMTFLETSVRRMATITGGSPFYIRNRFKAALFDGGESRPVTLSFDGQDIAATELVFHPFEGDPNSARMGDFAGLELRFVVSEEVPGGLLLLSAATPATGDDTAAYRETITLEAARQG